MKTTPVEHPEVSPSLSEQQGLGDALGALVRGWDRFWFRPMEPTTLGVIRICTGLIVLYVHIAYSFGLYTNYVGPNAWVNNDVLKWLRFDVETYAPAGTWDGMDQPVDKGQYIWSIYYHVQDPTWVAIIHTGILVVMFLFLIGLWTRITSVLTWVGSIMYIQRVPALLFGMDTMTNLGLFYLMIAPCGSALSLDRWLDVRRERRRRGPGWVPPPPEPTVSANFATRLIQVNFCIIYLAAGFSKLLGTSWWNATAPNQVLLNYSFAPFYVGAYQKIIIFLARHRWLWECVMSAFVVFTFIVEIGFPFLVWNRHTRWVMVCGSVLLHTAIGLFMGLVTFSLMMLAMVLSFVPPEALRQTLDRFFAQARLVLRPRTPPGGGTTAPQEEALALSR
jgi:hypothetical protein